MLRCGHHQRRLEAELHSFINYSRFLHITIEYRWYSILQTNALGGQPFCTLERLVGVPFCRMVDH